MYTQFWQNQVAYEYLNAQSDVSELKQEVTYGNSRFDLACYRGGKYSLYEVKCVNLLVGRIAMFSDAPTERGSKHLAELIKAQKEGYGTGVIFVVLRNDATSFTANAAMDPEFAGLLDQCHSLGMEIRALSCDIDGVNIEIIGELPVNVLSDEILERCGSHEQRNSNCGCTEEKGKQSNSPTPCYHRGSSDPGTTTF